MNLLSKSSIFARQLSCAIFVQRIETINQHVRFSSQYVCSIIISNFLLDFFIIENSR